MRGHGQAVRIQAKIVDSDIKVPNNIHEKINCG